MNNLVQIYEIEGEPVPERELDWCAVIETDTQRTVCGHALDECRSVEFRVKSTTRGGVTCPYCLDYIKQHKAIRL